MSTDNGKRSLFSDAERARIREAIEAAEANTAGEIAVMVVDTSDSYPEAERLGAFLLAGLVAFIVCIFLNHITIWTFIPVLFLLLIPAFWLLRFLPAFRRPFIGRKRMEEIVRERAVRAFYEKGLYRTRDETGILIFISVFERKVWILGDRGINARISPDYWESLAHSLATGIREGRACEALCDVIQHCCEELAQHFPRQKNDRNELADDLMTSPL